MLSATIVHARRNAVGYLALFVALGGTSYAVTLPRNSVGSKQLRKGAVTSSKVKNRSLKGADFARGQLPKGEPGPKGDKGDTGPATGPAGGDLSGSFPNPEIAPGAVGAAERGATPAARAYRTTNQATDGGGNVTVAFDGENFDTADVHSNANPSRLTAPVTGVYLLVGNVRWSGTGGDRYLSVVRNGDPNMPLAEAAAGPETLRQDVTGTARLAGGDYVELQGFENAASQLQVSGTFIAGVSPALSLVWLGP